MERSLNVNHAERTRTVDRGGWQRRGDVGRGDMCRLAGRTSLAPVDVKAFLDANARRGRIRSGGIV